MHPIYNELGVSCTRALKTKFYMLYIVIRLSQYVFSLALVMLSWPQRSKKLWLNLQLYITKNGQPFCQLVFKA